MGRQVLHHTTGGEDLLRERRDRPDRRLTLRRAQDRANIIAWLRTQSANPVPLP